MPNVFYKYNIEKDRDNILRVLTTKPFFDSDNIKRTQKGLSDELIININQITDQDVKKNIIDNYLKNQQSEKKSFINEKIFNFQNDWDKINNNYFQKLEKILNINIPKLNIYTGYLTSAGSCPFNAKERWFMVRMGDEKVDMTTAHEIMHIEFIWTYGFYCQKLGLTNNQFNIFREAITVLLNEEMKDILSKLDYGYKEHQEYRKIIVDLWRKNNDFKKIIERAKDFIKP